MTPEIPVCFRQAEVFAAFMSVPEAAVDKNDGLIFLQDNVRRAGQLPNVDTIAQTPGEQILPDNHLRLGIFPFHRRHAAATLLRRHHVSHCI